MVRITVELSIQSVIRCFYCIIIAVHIVTKKPEISVLHTCLIMNVECLIVISMLQSLLCYRCCLFVLGK